MTDNDDIPGKQETQHRKLINMETSKIACPVLQRYYARGVVTIVAKEPDRVEVARK
ncbi:MAG: hypothetical protein L0Z73_04990 [Gammaproteobacteria bacterium]|nr:hypothetical protein [Gammaproteobacteria bacterium]